MQKSKFYEKVGKLTFSIVLTWVLVTVVVFAAVRTNFVDWEILSAVDLNAIQPAIDTKVSITSIPECADGESLTFKLWTFSCFSAAAAITPEWIQAGMVYHSSYDNKTITVTFSPAFSWTPKVIVSAADLIMKNDSRWEEFDLGVSYSNVTKTWFKIYLDGQNTKHTDFIVKSASWVAIPPTWTWSTASSSSYTHGCGNKRTINNEKSGSCLVGLTNTYYSWESTCTYMINVPKSGEPELIEVSWYKYSSKKYQSCN